MQIRGLTDRDCIVAAPGEGERFDRGDRIITIKADLPQMSVLELSFDTTFSVAPHLHDDHVDSFYVLEGQVEFVVGDRTILAGPGTTVVAPPGTTHGFRNAGSGWARLLNVHAPDAGFADAVRGL